MAEAGEIRFRRIRVPVPGGEIWIDWDEPADGPRRTPFTLCKVAGLANAGSFDSQVVVYDDIVGWRRAPDPVAGPGEDGEGVAASGPGPGDQR